MPYKVRIQKMNQGINELEQILKESVSNNIDEKTIAAYNKRLYDMKQELSRLNRMQWEEDTQRVNFEDDR